MASRRYRSKLTLNSNLSEIKSQIDEISKRPDSRKIANESITNLSIKEGTIIAENIANNTITKTKLTSDVYDNTTFTGVTTVDRIGGIYYPYAMAAGQVSITAVANTNVSVTVTIDANRFTEVPIINLTPTNTGLPAQSSVSVDTPAYDPVTGVVTFLIVLNRTTSTVTLVNWMAVQMNPQA